MNYHLQLLQANQVTMAYQAQRDLTVTLRNDADYTAWLTQLQSRCVVYNVWDKINPATTTELTQRPIAIRAPVIADYAPAANIQEPARQSELSTAGLKAFKEDLEYYKTLSEQYRSDRHEFEKEQTSLQQITVFIQSSVTPHLLRTCCLPDQSLRQWLTNLKQTVGVDERLEQERARERYICSLKPMRSVSNWETWLAEYDQAATDAEAHQVVEVSQINAVTKDFLLAVNKIAPMWSINFQDHGRFEDRITRKEMMKRFREHLMVNHPLKSGKNRAAFAVDDTSLDLPASGNTTQGRTRDASPAEYDPLPNRGRLQSNPNRGRPRYKNQPSRNGDDTQSTRQTAAEEKCPACGKFHNLRKCYYINPDIAPPRWNPNKTLQELINYKRKNDTTFQGLIRGQSKLRFRSPTPMPRDQE